MAKGVEDTLMYTYNRFIGNNEVGDSPETFGTSIVSFHKKMKYRQANWPLSINATATHDTKRGEDVSARLNVLTDLPEEWFEAVNEWRILNEGLKTNGFPDTNDEYFIYQALVSTYPFHSDDSYEERFHAYISKALREAKIHSNWNTPNEEYETAAKNFASGLLDKSKPFWKSFKNFQDKISDHGIINSLTKVLLKFTCPGIPDVYQGCELWDFNMVDPDNRRPVNYEQRIEWLDKISKEKEEHQDELLKLLWENRADGNIKLWLIHNLLKERKENQELFHEGHYIPLKVKGAHKKHIIAFARRHKDTWYVVASAIHTASLCKKQGKKVSEIDWENTRIVLPDEAPENWNGLLHKISGTNKKGIEVGQLFKDLPLAFIKMKHAETSRSAGILMHITSLPSLFGIGDFGPEAVSFANFLSRSRQKYWQLLPLNITEAGNAHSPYSSISSMAGNTLLISPEGLAKDGLLDAQEIKQFHLPSAMVVDFEEAERIKDLMFEKAYQKFIQQRSSTLGLEFKSFCETEAHWLHDFALYVRIKRHYHGNAWYKWPEALKLRDELALKEFAENHEDALDKIKWLQFMFARQWKSLKRYCNNLGIQLFGDLPFYVSYDSADVWSNPDIFALDEKGNITGVAGVPPDYFNSDGQLWGMPVFKWDVLKNRNYDWWIQRIKKNMEFYDVLRLDHFRAFADYWEVAAKEKTAKKGTWKPGPGADFFQAIKNALGELPFIAEDLGDINDEVHKLRDDFNLPGMKVLQFAFGNDMSTSIYIPHNYNANYLAYTGTHDNNTTVGWFRQDAGKTERKNLYRYLGVKPKEKNIHTLLSKLAYSSVAQTAIIPLQDLLGLDENSRMNIPASMDKNWVWRLKRKQLTEEYEKQLREWVKMYNR
jgi:4-alpha-glucanotransferase